MCVCMVRFNAIVIPQVRSLGEAMIWVLELEYGSFSSPCQRVVIPSRYHIIGTRSLVRRLLI